MHFRATGDLQIKAKADAIVSELARCQVENGGEWVGPIPEKYLYWIARGKSVWAPQYTMHKVIMGLLDMVELAGNQQALEIVKNLASWFCAGSGATTARPLPIFWTLRRAGCWKSGCSSIPLQKIPRIWSSLMPTTARAF